MTVFDRPDYDDHEQIVFVREARVGLRAIIAIHDAAAYGVAGGGCRMWSYPNEQAAIDDALRLSKAMTYKLALADLPAGGAKMVVLGDPRRDKSEALLEAIGVAVHRLHGRFVIGSDVGTSRRDLEVVARETPYVNVHRGDAALATAYGVFLSLRWAAELHLGRGLEGMRVAIQGVGQVGSALGRLLRDAGATLVVSDVDEGAVERARRELGAAIAPNDEIYGADVDAYAPCALGGVIDDAAASRLTCRVVAGAANNPLANAGIADALDGRGILFVPDIVANLGGVIGSSPQASGEDRAAYLEPIAKITALLDEVHALARANGSTLHAAAETLARRRVAARRSP